MNTEEQDAYDTLVKIEHTIEEIVEEIDPKDVPILEFVFTIINQNFHYLYQLLFHHFTCCLTSLDDEIKEE